MLLGGRALPAPQFIDLALEQRDPLGQWRRQGRPEHQGWESSSFPTSFQVPLKIVLVRSGTDAWSALNRRTSTGAADRAGRARSSCAKRACPHPNSWLGAQLT